MNEDPILKLAVHLDRHHNRQQAFFSTAALRALLERLADSNRDLEKMTKERDNLEANWRARPTGTRLQREAQLKKRLEESEALSFELATQVNTLKAELEMARNAIRSEVLPQQQLREEVEKLREKLLLSDTTLQFVSVKLGGPDEWSTHETMISSVRRTAEAAESRATTLEAEVEKLTKQIEALQTQFGAMRERTVAAEAEIERHLKDKSDWADKWEAEHNSYLDQRERATVLAAEVERLTVEKSQSSWGEFQRQRKMLEEAQAEIEKLRGYEQTHIQNLDLLRAEVEKLTKERDEALKSVNEMSERFRAVNVDAVAHVVGGDIFALRARCEELQKERKGLERQLEEAKAAAPHSYAPSTMHMGDCYVCGNSQDAPQHTDWKAEVERLTKQIEALQTQFGAMRERTVAAETEVEKLRGYEQLHIDNLERLRTRNTALEAQVKRLIAKEGERIIRTLNERLDEPLPELKCAYPDCKCPVSFPAGHKPSVATECPQYSPRMDANGNPIPWPMDADYFMAFDPANPDVPTD